MTFKIDENPSHATHCCKRCGCKYGQNELSEDGMCPVMAGAEEGISSVDCEFCSELIDSLDSSVPDDDIEIHELLRRLAKKAQGLGWDIPKLQDEVFAHFSTVNEAEETPP